MSQDHLAGAGGKTAAAHTPGPWVLRTRQDFNIGTQDGYAIADPAFDYSSLSREELEANARLIAAAPELLEALQRAASVIAALDYPVDTSITQAIAKATGSAT